MTFGELVQKKMKEKINQDVKCFIATTDIWPSQTIESFMAITLHALTQDFDMINLTLAVEPLQGKHTGGFIQKGWHTAYMNGDLITRT